MLTKFVRPLTKVAIVNPVSVKTVAPLSSFLTIAKPREIIPARKMFQSVQQILPPYIGAWGFLPGLFEETTVSNITCRRSTMADKDDIVEFLSHMFIAREPLMKALKSTIPEAEQFLEHHVKGALRHNASFVAVDEMGKICGIRLNSIGPAAESEYACVYGPKMNTVNKFLSHVEEGLRDELNTDRFMRHIAICVKPEIMKCGVGTMLMKQSVDYAKSAGLKYMVATCTGQIATKLASKMGFEVVKEVPYDTYTDSNDSLVNSTLKPFHSLVGKHYSAKLMVRNVH